MAVMGVRTISRTSIVDAGAADVWSRVTAEAGINHELMPLMRMRFPRHLRDASITTAPVGEPLGRAWIFYLGFLPLDYDDLVLAEVAPGSHFQEVSTMLSMRRWEHRRELRDLGGGRTEVSDTVGFEPRLPVLGVVLEPVVRALFAHRHRRLTAYFSAR